MIVGIGIDLIDIERVQRLFDSKGDHALRRLFSEGERSYSMARPHPAQHLAARLAAKEATFKALSGSLVARGIGWRDIEVQVADDGRPTLVLHGAAERRASELSVTRVFLSLTHSAMTAAAVVVLEAREFSAG